MENFKIINKKTFYSTIICLFFATIVLGQNDADKELFKNLVNDSFDDIWSGLDASKMKKYYTDDFILLENGAVWNADTISNYFDKARQSKQIPKRENSCDVIKVKISNGTAWIAYHNYATITFENGDIRKLHWLESLTAIQTKNGWKIQMMHSTRIKPKLSDSPK